MNKRIPNWQLPKVETTRSRSDKQEKRIAKEIGGKKHCNSGAKFSENDVSNGSIEVEAKTTKAASYKLTLQDWNKLISKANARKIPVMAIDFEGTVDRLAVINYNDLIYLLNKK